MKHEIRVTCAGVFTPVKGPPFLALRTSGGHVFEMPSHPDFPTKGLVLGAAMTLTLEDDRVPPITGDDVLDLLSERYPDLVPTREIYETLSGKAICPSPGKRLDAAMQRVYGLLYRLNRKGAVTQTRDPRVTGKVRKGWTYVPECER